MSTICGHAGRGAFRCNFRSGAGTRRFLGDTSTSSHVGSISRIPECFLWIQGKEGASQENAGLITTPAFSLEEDGTSLQATCNDIHLQNIRAASKPPHYSRQRNSPTNSKPRNGALILGECKGASRTFDVAGW